MSGTFATGHEDDEILALFQQLPQLLDLQGGQVRATAYYREGTLQLRVEVQEFRIPAHRLSRPLLERPPRISAEARAVLEQIAVAMRETVGEVKLVAEYKDRCLKGVDLLTVRDIEVPVAAA